VLLFCSEKVVVRLDSCLFPEDCSWSIPLCVQMGVLVDEQALCKLEKNRVEQRRNGKKRKDDDGRTRGVVPCTSQPEGVRAVELSHLTFPNTSQRGDRTYNKKKLPPN
jgi:hypothetical protein